MRDDIGLKNNISNIEELTEEIRRMIDMSYKEFLITDRGISLIEKLKIKYGYDGEVLIYHKPSGILLSKEFIENNNRIIDEELSRVDYIVETIEYGKLEDSIRELVSIIEEHLYKFKELVNKIDMTYEEFLITERGITLLGNIDIRYGYDGGILLYHEPSGTLLSKEFIENNNRVIEEELFRMGYSVETIGYGKLKDYIRKLVSIFKEYLYEFKELVNKMG